MRLDKYLVEQKFFSSRARAKEAIERGDILVNGVPHMNPDFDVHDGIHVEAQSAFPWVSRGALKLIAALDAFGVDPAGLSVLDLGASTGGFTEVLLSRGAAKVYAVDVGHEQLHSRLRGDPRVVCMEGTDVRQLVPNHFPLQFQLIVGDLSFISLTKVLPTIHTLMSQGGSALLLVKPQFEVGVGGTKKGIVKDENKRKEVLHRIERDATQLGFVFLEGIESPVQGGSGNVEYLIHLRA